MKKDFIILAAFRNATHNFTTFSREQLEELHKSCFLKVKGEGQRVGIYRP
jgi:hypothetical protein